jgi:hypothetical protein
MVAVERSTERPAGASPRGRWLWPAIIGLSAVAVGLATLAGVQGPVRAGLALWFLLICPGLALVRLLRLDDTVFELTLGVALSLALDTLVAGGLLYAGAWSPAGALAVLIAISVAGALLQLALARQGARPVPGGPR